MEWSLEMCVVFITSFEAMILEHHILRETLKKMLDVNAMVQNIKNYGKSVQWNT